MVSRYAAVRSLIVLTYDYLKLDPALTSASYAALMAYQQQLAIADAHLIPAITAELGDIWPDLALLEATEGSAALVPLFNQMTKNVLAAGATARDRGSQPFPTDDEADSWEFDQGGTWLINGGLLLVSLAIAGGIILLGQYWRSTSGLESTVISTAEAGHAGAIGGAEGGAESNNELGIHPAVFTQLQHSFAIAKGLDWARLSPTEQAQLTQTLTTALATLPEPLRTQIGAQSTTAAKQLMQPPADCRRSAQALYDQADLVLYRLFPDLLGQNIAGTGFDQVWYALLAQQMADQC